MAKRISTKRQTTIYKKYT